MNYRLRAECRADVEKLAATLARAGCGTQHWVVAGVEIGGYSVPDVDIAFETDESLEGVRVLIDTIQDGNEPARGQA
jgi:hypothetical protein